MRRLAGDPVKEERGLDGIDVSGVPPGGALLEETNKRKTSRSGGLGIMSSPPIADRAVMAQGVSEFDIWVLHAWKRGGAVLPAFPLVATRLVDALENPNAHMESVCEIIVQDPALTADVIRMANSIVYGGVTRVEDVRSAVMRLGLEETANVAMTVACRSLFAMEDRAEIDTFGELWSSIWSSSLVGAYGARILSSELGLGHPEQIFQAAMFRDIGCLLLLKVITKGLVSGSLRDRPSEAEIHRVFDSLHERAGAGYARQSFLPLYVMSNIRSHHRVDEAVNAETIPGHLIVLTDAFCRRLGIMPLTDEASEARAERSAKLLGLDEVRMEYFALQFESIHEQLSDLM